jgi:ubiquinone/menaquinone biosynthesis C-methylase UbiE
MNDLKKSVETVAEAWKESPYYASAEEWTYLFWKSNTIFRILFDQLDLSNVVELACGHGRHAVQCAKLCGKLTLLDIFPSHLEKCRERLAGNSNVNYLLGNGYDFTGIKNSSVTAIYSYDAMVHFAPNMVESYMSDAGRILLPGGKFLLHHSNFSANPASPHYGLNPHARNHMSYEMLKDFASSTRLKILETVSIQWGNDKDLDRVSLLQKPL